MELVVKMAGKYIQDTMFKTSANNINSSSLEKAARSLIQIMKNKGPSIEPCGTPQICLKASDLERLLNFKTDKNAIKIDFETVHLP